MQQLPPERGDLARMLTGLSDAQVAARSRLTWGGSTTVLVVYTAIWRDFVV